MSEKNNNVDQCAGDAQPQAPRARTVESVDDGNQPLNSPKVEQKKSVLN